MIISCLQWNIDYREDVSKVVNLVRSLSPDIFSLQELIKSDTLDAGSFICSELGVKGAFEYGPMVLPDGKEALMGVGVFSKYPITACKKVVLQPAVIEDDRIMQDERLYIQIEIALPNDKSIAVGTTHLPFHPKFYSTLVKLEMTERILQAFPAGEYILTGDFNSLPRTKVMKILKQSLKSAGPSDSAKTWTTKPFRIGPYTYDELAWRLDYIFYKGSMKSKAAALVETELSDHVPILARFEV